MEVAPRSASSPYSTYLKAPKSATMGNLVTSVSSNEKYYITCILRSEFLKKKKQQLCTVQRNAETSLQLCHTFCGQFLKNCCHYFLLYFIGNFAESTYYLAAVQNVLRFQVEYHYKQQN